MWFCLCHCASFQTTSGCSGLWVDQSLATAVGLSVTKCRNYNVLLTLHLCIFISVSNQLDAQNLFHNKLYSIPQHVSSTCAHHQEVKIALHSLWYHHTYRWPSLNPCTRRPPVGVMIPEAV